MSTKSTLFLMSAKNNCEHELNIHVYNEMHESDEVIKFQFWCSTCHCNYEFIMTKHLGKQLVEMFKKSNNVNEGYKK